MTVTIYFKFDRVVLKSQMLKIFSIFFPSREKKKVILFLKSSSVLHVVLCYLHCCSPSQIKSCFEKYRIIRLLRQQGLDWLIWEILFHLISPFLWKRNTSKWVFRFHCLKFRNAIETQQNETENNLLKASWVIKNTVVVHVVPLNLDQMFIRLNILKEKMKWPWGKCDKQNWTADFLFPTV